MLLPDEIHPQGRMGRSSITWRIAMMKSFVSPIRLIAVLLAVTALCAAQQDKAPAAGSSLVSGTKSPAAPAEFQARSPRYHIEPGDSFDITFDLSPEFNQTGVAVQPDGFVTLHGIGDIKVQGQTVPELTSTLRKAYSRILNNPIISVVLRDFQKPYFIADGQIIRPGKY